MLTIGVSGNQLIDDMANQAGHRKSYVSMDYVDAIITTGAMPLVLPLTLDEAVIKNYIGKIDGLLLSGGQDVAPYLYGEDPKLKLKHVLPERDKFEYLLIKYAMEAKMPIFGVCRGLQILNVYFGGTLHQDLSYGEFWVQHNQEQLPTFATHAIKIVDNTELARVFAAEQVFVNSFHHQVINKPADKFIVSAVAADGAIEAIEAISEEEFILAVQWHPEMLAPAEEAMYKLFSRFYEAITNK